MRSDRGGVTPARALSQLNARNWLLLLLLALDELEAIGEAEAYEAVRCMGKNDGGKG